MYRVELVLNNKTTVTLLVSNDSLEDLAGPGVVDVWDLLFNEGLAVPDLGHRHQQEIYQVQEVRLHCTLQHDIRGIHANFTS